MASQKYDPKPKSPKGPPADPQRQKKKLEAFREKLDQPGDPQDTSARPERTGGGDR